MENSRIKNEYFDSFRRALSTVGGKRKLLIPYLENECNQMEMLVSEIGSCNFWLLYPKILGIDAKLTLMNELIQYSELSNDEVLRIVEDDYKEYFNELCGYEKQSTINPSMIFNIL